MIRYFPIFTLFVCLLVACGGSSGDGSGRSGADNEGLGEAGSEELSFSAPQANQIRPGGLVTANGSQCTSNFLFYLNDETVYLGVAAHCFSPDTNSGIDPCEARSLPVGFNEVQVENASRPAELVYSSWVAMQEVGESPGSAACEFNDFALVRLAGDDIANIHPAVREVGGPTALESNLAGPGDPVVLFGRSDFTLGNRELQVREGQVVEVLGGGWAYDIVADGSVSPGDSGGPVLTGDGRALAVVSTFTLVLGSGSLAGPVRAGVVNLDRALDYAKEQGFIHADVRLLTWSAFSPPAL